jgi:hypothetical protein
MKAAGAEFIPPARGTLNAFLQKPGVGPKGLDLLADEGIIQNCIGVGVIKPQ